MHLWSLCWFLFPIPILRPLPSAAPRHPATPGPALDWCILWAVHFLCSLQVSISTSASKSRTAGHCWFLFPIPIPWPLPSTAPRLLQFLTGLYRCHGILWAVHLCSLQVFSVFPTSTRKRLCSTFSDMNSKMAIVSFSDINSKMAVVLFSDINSKMAIVSFPDYQLENGCSTFFQH